MASILPLTPSLSSSLNASEAIQRADLESSRAIAFAVSTAAAFRPGLRFPMFLSAQFTAFRT
jgi:hypothetical protein